MLVRTNSWVYRLAVRIPHWVVPYLWIESVRVEYDCTTFAIISFRR